jgi:hypothetical protein
MKITVLLAYLLLSSCIPSTDGSESTVTPEEQEIAKNLIQGAFDDLWGGVDSTKIEKYHTEDFIILENGEVWDNERIKQFMREQLANPDRARRVNLMDYVSIEKYGPSIQIAYHNRAEFYQQDSLVGTGSWLESATAIKTTDGWRLRMMHSTWNKK